MSEENETPPGTRLRLRLEEVIWETLRIGVTNDERALLARRLLMVIRPIAAGAWDEGYMRGRHPWTDEREKVDPIPEGDAPPRWGRNANPYKTGERVET